MYEEEFEVNENRNLKTDIFFVILGPSFADNSP